MVYNFSSLLGILSQLLIFLELRYFIYKKLFSAWFDLEEILYIILLLFFENLKAKAVLKNSKL